jgi:hypothetical protein
MPLPYYTKTFESDSGTSVSGWLLDSGLAVDATSKMTGAKSLAATTTGVKMGIYGTADSGSGDVALSVAFRMDSISATTSSVTIAFDVSDPNPANFLTASSYRATFSGCTSSSTWALTRSNAGTNTTLASYSAPANTLLTTVKYLAFPYRRGSLVGVSLQRVSDSLWFNPTTNAFQATRVPVFAVTDGAPLAASAGYTGIRLNMASGVSCYADDFKLYSPAATTYYVSSLGSDGNDGVTTGTPLLTPAAAIAMNPHDLNGDTILCRGGDTFTLTALLNCSTGRAWDSYGTGRAILTRSGPCLMFRDCDSWSIGVATGNGLNFNVTNTTSNCILSDCTDNTRRAGGVTIQNVDCQGGGATIAFQAAQGTTGGLNGVVIGNGLGESSVVCHDAVTGGIFFLETNSGTVKHYSNVLIDGFTIYNITGSATIPGVGIAAGQMDSTTGTNAARCIVRNGSIRDIGANCSTSAAGPGGFFPINSDGVLFERIRVANTLASSGGGGDGHPFDFDTNSSNCEIRLCESHDTDGGLLCFSTLAGNSFHHNTLYSPARTALAGLGAIRLDDVGAVDIFNNTVVMNNAANAAVYATSRTDASKGKRLFNNLLVNKAASSTVIDLSAMANVGTGFVMEGNSYQDANGVFVGKTKLLSGGTSSGASTSYTTGTAWKAATGLETTGGFFATSSPYLGYSTAYPTISNVSTMVATIGHFFDPQGSLTTGGVNIGAAPYNVATGTKDWKGGTIPTPPYAVGAVTTGLGAALTAGTATGGATGITTAAATATDATNGTSPYSYQWYRSTTGGSIGTPVSGQTTRTLADTGLTAGTTYYYTLRFSDAAAATADSNQVTLATKANLAAGTITPGSTTTTTVAATATDATGGVTPYSYQWFRSTSSGTLGSTVSGQTTRTLADSGLTASTTYYYTLRYTDSSGTPVVINSAQAAIATTGASLVAGVASPGSSTVTTASASGTDATGGTAPYTYQWYKSTSSGSLGTAVSGQTTRTLLDTGLTPGTDYFYTLRYTDAAGSPASANSNQVQVTTKADLAAGSATVSSFTPTTVYITAGDATGGVTPYSYQWYRSTASGSIGAAVAGQTTLSLIDPGRTASTTYYYTLRYTDSSSTPRTKDSAQVAVTTATTASSDISSASITAIVSAIVAQFQTTPPPVVLAGLVDSSTDPTTGGGTAAANLKSDLLQPSIGPSDVATAVAALLPTLQQIAAASAAAVGPIGLNMATVTASSVTGFTATVNAPDGTPVSVGSGGFKGMNALPQAGKNFRRTIASHQSVGTTHTFVIDINNPWPSDGVPGVGSIVILG